MSIVIGGSGMITAVGVGTEQVLAAIGAGISLYKDSAIYDNKGIPFKLATVPDACLPKLDPATKLASPKGRYKRMLRLALAGITTLLPSLPKNSAVPLFLALPGRHGGMTFPALEPFLKDFHAQGARFDLAASKVFPSGRAAGAEAMQAAVQALQSGQAQHIIVGGVDTALDLALLNQWHSERRLLTSMTMQGFVPGEGAGFLLLSQAENTSGAIVVSGVGTGSEPGHTYSDEICRAEGLMQAINTATAASPEPAQTVCCGLTGENVAIKEWGITATKTKGFASDFVLMHPAENYGDLGAASIPVLIAISAAGMTKQKIKGPVVVWASSDLALRGAISLYQA